LSDGDIFDSQFSARPGSENRVYRRPDSDDPKDRFRLYELAGVAHMGTRYPPHNNPQMWGAPATAPEGKKVFMNSLPHHELFNMTLDHLVKWVDKGVEPPRAGRIALEPDGRYCAKDDNGNTLGGIRCAQMDVPRATYHPNALNAEGKPIWGPFCTEVPFEPAKMQALYGHPASYVARFNARLDELVDQGWFLADDTAKMRAEAAAQQW
jgi:hypothetical protein